MSNILIEVDGMKYEKLEKISFDDAIERMQKGYFCICKYGAHYYVHKKSDGGNLIFINKDGCWVCSEIPLARLFQVEWFAVKYVEEEEKFIPTE